MIISRSVLAGMILLGVWAGSCSDKHTTGGSCTYDTIPGNALIIVADSVVTFDFTPDDPTAPDRYQYTYIPDSGFALFISTDSIARSQWLSDQGFEAGLTYPCNRTEITRGTCTPMSFEFPDQDYHVGRAGKPVFFACD